MTVKQLIDHLVKYKDDTEVVIPASDGLYNLTNVTESFFNSPDNNFIKLESSILDSVMIDREYLDYLKKSDRTLQELRKLVNK